MAVKKSTAASVKTEKVVAPKAAPVAVAPVEVKAEAAKVEASVAHSPVVEKLQETVADVQKSVSQIVTKLTNTQTEVSTNMDKVIKGAEEFVAFGQANVEAFMKSSQILATGLHAYLTQFLDRVNDLGMRISKEFLIPTPM